MRTKRYWLVLAVTFVLVAALLLPACAEEAPAPAPAPTPAPEPVKPVTLKFSYTMPSRASSAEAWEEYGEEVEEQTGGKVKFDFYPGSTLFTIHETPDSLLNRVADIANLSCSVSRKLFPLFEIVQYPGLAFPADIDGFTAAAAGQYKMIEKFPELKAEFKDFKVLFFSVVGNYIPISTVPIRVPDDFSGLRIGGTGMKGDLVEALGGAPVAFAPPETYMNVKTGVVDACYLCWFQVDDYKM